MRKITIALVAAIMALSVGACEELDSGAGDSDQVEKVKEEMEGKGKKLTKSQENAIDAATNYLDLSGFSKKGLIQQLSSKAGDGYPKKDAVFAVNHIKVNWNKEAVEAAEAYLDTSSFSRDGLIQQLESDAGSGFTHEQAVHAANKVGL